jgi:glycosyltransferase 2 family protein
MTIEEERIADTQQRSTNGEQRVVSSAENEVDRESPEWEEPSLEHAEEELSIGHRLANWKSLLSFSFAVAVLVVVIVKGGVDPSSIWKHLKTLNYPLFLGALVVYYATFPLRGYRWKILLQNAYRHTHSEAVGGMSIRGLSEILYISWFVNCVVPAKLGDLYRAYLAKLWARIPWTKTVGTIMAERIIDILVLSLLLAVTGLVAFHGRLGHVSLILLLGIGLAIVGIVALVLMKTLSPSIRRLVPDRFEHRYVSLEEGTLHSFQRLPLLLGLTALIWLMEGARLQLVVNSLGLQDRITALSTIPFVPMLFLALGTAVLTTIPFTPGGLGLVEVGLGSLMIYLGVHRPDAAAIVVFDRILSYYSIAFFGFLVYLLSKRSHFRHPV